MQKCNAAIVLGCFCMDNLQKCTSIIWAIYAVRGLEYRTDGSFLMSGQLISDYKLQGFKVLSGMHFHFVIISSKTHEINVEAPGCDLSASTK